MQAMIEKTCMHAAIIGQQYTQLQNQVNAKTNAPETSCQSFSGMAHVLNTTEALATIAAERAEEVSKAQEKEQERWNKVEKAEEAHVAKAKKQYQRWVAAAVNIVNDCITQEEKAHQAQGSKRGKGPPCSGSKRSLGCCSVGTEDRETACKGRSCSTAQGWKGCREGWVTEEEEG
ncbi:hypothetical protein BS47DRAFT_1359178 [Hydnum rufescens UP504]|uniref:Uncharacterized protein n=1 Tax=Hydnum rufescens UP504 TaxID=1448309 RepID=A0A9P6B5L3_9AGAM|nr:hypothetical protein BS47DRAFT_1359178 [Hydnum rufescens UP504]